MIESPTTLTGPFLFLDASRQPVVCAIAEADRWTGLAQDHGDVLESLFPLTETVLRQAGRQLTDMKAFVYCEGPGSLLGIRISVMALATWKRLPRFSGIPFFAFRSLALCARLFMAQPGFDDRPFAIISAFRKGEWNTYRFPGDIQSLETTGSVESWTGFPVFAVAQRRNAPAAPAHVRNFDVPFPSHLPPSRVIPSVRRIENDPTVYVPGEATFVPWKPERHRSP